VVIPKDFAIVEKVVAKHRGDRDDSIVSGIRVSGRVLSAKGKPIRRR